VFVVDYNESAVAAAGWHELTVRVKRAGKYEVLARKGYWGN
jgi:hypothetical protein